LTGDPTISWHAENAALTATEPTFGDMTLTARTVCCLVKMSLELSQDSANIEHILQRPSPTPWQRDRPRRPGGRDDRPHPVACSNLSGRNTVTSIGAPTSWDFAIDGMYELMADNVPAESIGAMVAHPALWKKMRKLKTGITNDNTPLDHACRGGRTAEAVDHCGAADGWHDGEGCHCELVATCCSACARASPSRC
jgi:hypothetical protein